MSWRLPARRPHCEHGNGSGFVRLVTLESLCTQFVSAVR